MGIDSKELKQNVKVNITNMMIFGHFNQNKFLRMGEEQSNELKQPSKLDKIRVAFRVWRYE